MIENIIIGVLAVLLLALNPIAFAVYVGGALLFFAWLIWYGRWRGKEW